MRDSGCPKEFTHRRSDCAGDQAFASSYKHHFDQRARMRAGLDVELGAVGLDQRLGQRKTDAGTAGGLIRGGCVRNGSIAAATSLSFSPRRYRGTRKTTSPKSDSAVETMTWPPASARWIELAIRFTAI